jgi:rhomboid family protein
MLNDYRFRSTGYSWSNYFPPGVKWLLISNVAIFVLYFFTGRTELGQIFELFALSPRRVLGQFAVWQLFTYMFLHGGIGHILFNMLALWMFGMDLERDWGTKRVCAMWPSTRPWGAWTPTPSARRALSTDC